MVPPEMAPCRLVNTPTSAPNEPRGPTCSTTSQRPSGVRRGLPGIPQSSAWRSVASSGAPPWRNQWCQRGVPRLAAERRACSSTRSGWLARVASTRSTRSSAVGEVAAPRGSCGRASSEIMVRACSAWPRSRRSRSYRRRNMTRPSTPSISSRRNSPTVGRNGSSHTSTITAPGSSSAPWRSRGTATAEAAGGSGMLQMRAAARQGTTTGAAKRTVDSGRPGGQRAGPEGPIARPNGALGSRRSQISVLARSSPLTWLARPASTSSTEVPASSSIFASSWILCSGRSRLARSRVAASIGNSQAGHGGAIHASPPTPRRRSPMSFGASSPTSTARARAASGRWVSALRPASQSAPQSCTMSALSLGRRTQPAAAKASARPAGTLPVGRQALRFGPGFMGRPAAWACRSGAGPGRRG